MDAYDFLSIQADRPSRIWVIAFMPVLYRAVTTWTAAAPARIIFAASAAVATPVLAHTSALTLP